MGFLISAVIAALGLASAAYAKTAQSCPFSDFCFQAGIPSTTSGTGDVYFQISCATSYSWCALGQGSGMAGASIFVIYADAAGTNVTLSPRAGQEHIMPLYDNSTQVELLQGSGISNGMMTANFRCAQCSSTTQNYIWGSMSGSAISSDDTNAAIAQHSVSHSAAFTWDLSAAKLSTDVNPFTSNTTSSAGSVTTGSGGVSCTPTSAATSNTSAASATSDNPASYTNPWAPYASAYGAPTSVPTSGSEPLNNKRSSSGCPAGYAPVSSNVISGSSSLAHNDSGFSLDSSSGLAILTAHAVLAALAFAFLFPVGGILVRLATFPGLWWIHGLFQVVALLIYIVAAGLGIYMAMGLHFLDQAHSIIGLALLAFLVVQPFTGLLHHRSYARLNRRGVLSFTHIWVGRAAITVGIVNGVLGFDLAETEGSSRIAYIVIAVIVWLVYVAAIVFGEITGRRHVSQKEPQGQNFLMQNRGADERSAPSNSTQERGDQQQQR